MSTPKPWTRTPLEIWQEILELSIYPPIIFSTDPGRDSLWTIKEFGDTSIYWETERTRNALRRVKKSWDTYLRRFDHRFVDLADVEHGDVPLDAICRAIRIHITYCVCEKRILRLSQIGDSLDQISEDGTLKPWRLQTLLLPTDMSRE
ncbi:hypothetical protein PIIN_10820 [Serendipita indica DSM 11827]|uniref:Uncharacterized protein n=1 Tax=Serendipita indica (strain DSM 11827) TaxID=1109443 RepID=G4TZU1_SERID|nr:hypothetical protein PIIN_10820 [Serendipita indica DSM 11827]